ncbi:hypothetical protein [Endozoicomonas lisbonensis]|uniref:Uncharacterized protein n=1 Tax=Endozoicomonas lisbonensis TaxID=3120522 RepID=A0ABV2SDF9_9GAMM
MRTIIDAGKVHASTEQMEHSSKVVTDFPKLAKFLKWFPVRNSNLTQEELNAVALPMAFCRKNNSLYWLNFWMGSPSIS